VQCWDLSAEPPSRTSRVAHADRVERLAFSHDGSALFSGGRDKVVKRWSFPDLKETAAAPMGGAVAGLAVHPTEGWVYCTADNTSRFLSGETFQPIRPETTALCPCACFSCDGHFVLYALHSVLRVRDLRSQRDVYTFTAPGEERAHDGHVQSLALSPDGSLVLSASLANQVRLWETASGRLLADLAVDGTYPSVAFHPDGRSLVVTAGTYIRFYEIGGLREQSFVASQPYAVAAAALHPDGCRLARLSGSFKDGSGAVSVWSLCPDARARPAAHFTLPDFNPDNPHKLAMHPEGGLAACAPGGTLTLLDRPGRPAPSVVPGKANIAAAAFGPTGRLWLAAGADVQARGWPDGELAASWSSNGMRVLTGVSEPRCVAAGRTWIAAGGDNGLLYILPAAKPSLSAAPRITQGAVRSVALSADETTVAGGSDRGELCLVNVAGGAACAKATPHRDRVTALAFAGNRLLASGSRDRTVCLWHVHGGALRKLITLPTPGPVRWLALHPTGPRLFVLLDRERAVRLWRLDILRDRLIESGMGDDLEPIESTGLPRRSETSMAHPSARTEHNS
jgi:WD40 repeat protein